MKWNLKDVRKAVRWYKKMYGIDHSNLIQFFDLERESGQEKVLLFIEKLYAGELGKKEDPNRFVTPYKYAELCGVSHQAINQRIMNKSIEVTLSGDGHRLIDTEKFPPTKGRVKKSETEKKPEKVTS